MPTMFVTLHMCIGFLLACCEPEDDFEKIISLSQFSRQKQLIKNQNWGFLVFEKPVMLMLLDFSLIRSFKPCLVYKQPINVDEYSYM